MAKKLISRYSFIPASNTVVIKDIVEQERLLLITNSTDNVVIYAFNDDTIGAVDVDHNFTTQETTIELNYDCSSMSATDKLQIFIEQEYTQIEPSETFTDPVSKMRVSQPQNLIDTDFEYGLQSTKWETLELINNIPTFFAREGVQSLSLETMTVSSGNNNVNVTTTEDHGLIVGNPIIVKGAGLAIAEGVFVVTNVINPREFVFKSKQNSNITTSILDTYTEVLPASLYQGTEFKLESLGAITTDGASPSTVTVATRSPHGFVEGTTFYLLNSLTSNTIEFNGADVVPELDIEKQSVVDLSAPTTQNKITYFYSEAGTDPGTVGLTTVYSGLDDGAQLYGIDLDPEFKFFGQTYNKLWVSSQSKIIFSNTEPSSPIAKTTGYDENLPFPAIWLYPNHDYQVLKVYKEVVSFYSTRIRFEAIENDAGNTAESTPTLIWEIILDGTTDQALIKVFRRDNFTPETDLPLVIRDWNSTLSAANQERFVFKKVFDPDFLSAPANELYFITSGGVETTDNLLDYHNTTKFCPYNWTCERTTYRPVDGIDRTGTTFFALGKDTDDEFKSYGIVDSIHIVSLLNNVITFSGPHNLIENRPYLYIPGISNTGLTIAGTVIVNPTVYYVRTVAATYGGAATITDPETQCVLVTQTSRRVALTVNFGVPTAVVRYPNAVDRFGPHCFMAVSRVHYYSTTVGNSYINAPDTQSGGIITNQPLAFFAATPTGTVISTNNYFTTTNTVYYARNVNDASHVVGDWFTTTNNGTIAAAAINAATITLTIPQTSLNNSALFVAGTGNANIGHFVTFTGTNAYASQNITGIVVGHSGTTTRTFTIKLTNNLDAAIAIQSGIVGAQFASSTTSSGLTFNIATQPDNNPINLTGGVYDGYFVPVVYPWAPTKSFYDKSHNLSTNDILYHFTGSAQASALAIPGGLTNNVYYRAETVDNNRFRLLNDQTGATFNYTNVNGSQMTRSFQNRRTPKGMITDASVVTTSTTALMNTSKEQGQPNGTGLTDSVINFVGTGGITVQSSKDFAFGTGDFQIDMWVRRTSANSNQTLIDFRTSSINDVGLYIKLDADTLVWDYGGNNPRTVTTAAPVDTYTLVTVGRVDGEFKLLINGVERDSVTPADQNYSTHRIPKIGKNYANTNYFTGQMYGIRITRSWLYDAAKTAQYFRVTNEEFTVLYITGENRRIRDDNSLINRTSGPNEGQRKYKRDYGSLMWRQAGAGANATSVVLTHPMPGYSTTSVAQVPNSGNLAAGANQFTVVVASGFVGQSNFGIGHRVKLFDGTTFMPLLLSDGTAFNDLDIRVTSISGTRPAVTVVCTVMTPGGLTGTFTRITNGRMMLDTGVPVRDEDHLVNGSSWTKDYWDIQDDNSSFPNIGATAIDLKEDSGIATSQLENSVVTAITVADPISVTLGFPATAIPNLSVTRTTNVSRVTTARPHGLKEGGTVAIAGVSDGTFNNANAVILSTTVDTFTYANNGTDGASATGGTSSPVILARTTNLLTITNITRANPAVVTTSVAHGFTNGQPFIFQGIVVGDWGSLWTGTVIYYARVTAATTFEVYLGSGLQIGLNTSDYSTSYVSGTNAGRIFAVGTPIEFVSQRLTFSNRTAELNGDTIFIPGHNLNEGTGLIYANGGGTSIGGLDAGSTKYVFDPKPDRFRLADTQAGWSSNLISFTQSAAINITTSVFTTAAHGFTTGKQVQFLSPNPPIGLTNGHFYYVRVDSATAFRLFWTKNGAITNLAADLVKIVGTVPAVVATVRQAEVVDFTAVGIGAEHSFATPVQTGAVDGLYTIADAEPNGNASSFTLSNAAGITITKRIIGIEPTRSVNLLNSTFYLQDHKIVTGTALIYRTTGDAIGPLQTETTYYVISSSPNNFQLALTTQAAEAADFINLNTGNLFGTGSHEFEIATIVGANTGPGFAITTYRSRLITGNSTNFTASFKKGDQFGWYYPASIFNKAVTFAGSPSVFTSTGHNMANKHQVKWFSTVSPPDGFFNGTIYYVRRTAANTFTLHPTPTDVDNNTNGITALNGSGTHFVQFINEGNSGTGTIDQVLSKFKMRLTEESRVDFDGLYKIEVFSVTKTLNSASITITTPAPHPFVAGGIVYLQGTGDVQLDDIAFSVASVTVSTIVATLPALASATATYQVDNSIKCYGNATQAITTFSGTAASGLSTFTVANALGIAPGARVTGTGIPSGATVDNISATTVTLSVPHTGVTSGNAVTFDYGLYTIPSSLLLRADSSSLHRPYDGGVEIVTSSNPDSVMMRQTRRYFRYQSGKGIQVSFAVNFSPSEPIDNIQRIDATEIEIRTRQPHKLTTGLVITISGILVNGSSNNSFNGQKTVSQVINDYEFRVTSLPGEHPAASTAGGLGEFTVDAWSGTAMRCGLFDDQNGLFFEFDGSTLYVVRRNSTSQLTGKSSVVFNSNTITGTGTHYDTEIQAGEYIAIRGQTYKVTAIDSSVVIHIQPAYRGVSTDNVIISKIKDLKIAQQDWNIDPMDGTGNSGYLLDIHRIQMAYIDYSWYGAGKVRFGFKARDGVVRYVHQIVHGNLEREAYMRSGNLPARYEVRTLSAPTYVPKLAHWGTSVIMDGLFSEDKAYQFSANSNAIRTNSAASVNITASGIIRQVQQYSAYNNQGILIGEIGYAIEVNYQDALRFVGAGTGVTGPNVSLGTVLALPNSSAVRSSVGSTPFLINVRVSPINNTRVNLLVINIAPTAITGGFQNYAITQLTDLGKEIPLLSIRLAPSVDNGVPGELGSREIINRMQLALQGLDVLSTHDAELSLVLNADLDNLSWSRVTAPSLSQVIYHAVNDTIENGLPIFSFRVPPGPQLTTTLRGQALTSVDLDQIATLGNSIMGGDGVYPDGPDIITLKMRFLGLSTEVTNNAIFNFSARLSWNESQA